MCSDLPCIYNGTVKLIVLYIRAYNNMEVIRECDIFNDDSAEIIEVEEEKPKDKQPEKL